VAWWWTNWWTLIKESGDWFARIGETGCWMLDADAGD